MQKLTFTISFLECGLPLGLLSPIWLVGRTRRRKLAIIVNRVRLLIANLHHDVIVGPKNKTEALNTKVAFYKKFGHPGISVY